VIGTAASRIVVASPALNEGTAAVSWTLATVIAVSIRAAWAASRATADGGVTVPRAGGSRCDAPMGQG
jgi:hypothetical protein